MTPALALNALIADTEITTVCSNVVDGLIITQSRGLIINANAVNAGYTAKAGYVEVAKLTLSVDITCLSV